MENLDKKIDLKVTMGLRNEFLCKKCDIFPRPDLKLMRCSSCTALLCQNCCEDEDDVEGQLAGEIDLLTKCPLCHRKSKDAKISTFTEESQLLKLLSGFKTHPCKNLKNGCHEEIPAKLDTLKAHEENCIFQMVPCPNAIGNCFESFIFKDLEQHLKQVHTNEYISIFCGTEENQNASDPKIFGIYWRKSELVNGRNYYESYGMTTRYGRFGIWFTDEGNWLIGESEKKGGEIGFAKLGKGIQFPDTTTIWEWEWFPLWTRANYIATKDLSVSTEVWDFEGTEEELINSFCCLNVYSRQFYPNFKEWDMGSGINFRTLMLGSQEDTNSFLVSITFYSENKKKILTTVEENVYPITLKKDHLTDTATCTNWDLRKLTVYHDTETRKIKTQSKIIFRMKIICPKLDEITKDQHMESGLEDSDMEKEEG